MRPAVAALCAAALLASGCGVTGLDFVRDERVTIVAPGDREVVDLPVTVRWRVRDFEITGPDGNARRDAGYFAVLVDRPPPPPGQPVEWLVRNDELCQRDPGCPNFQYLADSNIFVTEQTSFTIDSLPDSTPDDARRDLHQVTIALLDGNGERIGESAYIVEFEVRR